MKRNYKKIAVIVAVMMLTLSITSAGFATDTMANLKAYYKNIRISRNGIQVPVATEPFIVDGTTYLPVRAISELLDKDVTWNQATYTISVNDRPGTDVKAMASQILNQQLTISQLEAKIKTLETKVKEEEEVVSLNDLSKDLLDDYDELDIFDVEEIKLKGDEDDITVTVYLDLDLDRSNELVEWEDFEDDGDFDEDVIDFLQDIVDDILDIEEYEDADIEGTIVAEGSGDKLIKFTVNTKGKVTLN